MLSTIILDSAEFPATKKYTNGKVYGTKSNKNVPNQYIYDLIPDILSKCLIFYSFSLTGK